MTSMDNFVDYYKVLEINYDSDEKQIAKAYRRQALKCHPDKNPNNKRAAEQFHLLSKAYEILSDEKAKKAFDAVIKARIVNEKRTQQMDAKRRAFKEKLEQAEARHYKNIIKSTVATDEIANASKNLQKEIDRLRTQGSVLLKKQQKRLARQLAEEEKGKQPEVDRENKPKKDPFSLKVTWETGDSQSLDNLPKHDVDSTLLNSLFSKFGIVENIVFSRKKSNLAIVEFKCEEDAYHCYLSTNLIGKDCNLIFHVKPAAKQFSNNIKTNQKNNYSSNTIILSSSNSPVNFSPLPVIESNSDCYLYDDKMDLEAFENHVFDKIKRKIMLNKDC